MKKNLEKIKYQIELEVVGVGERNRSMKMMKQTRKSITKVILSKLSGRCGEC